MSCGREVWTISLASQPEHAESPPPLSGTIGACAWSEDSLLAVSMSTSSSNSEDKQSMTCPIYVVHADWPERHVQAGAHEHDVTILQWGPPQLGICLMSADARHCICLWKPVDSLVNRWQLHHRFYYNSVKLAMWLNPFPSWTLPNPVYGKASETPAYQPPPAAGPSGGGVASQSNNTTYFTRYRRKPPPSSMPGVKPTDLPGVTTPPGCMCLLSLSRFGEARVFLELCAGPSGLDWGSSGARLSTIDVPEAALRPPRSSVSESGGSTVPGSLCITCAAATLKDSGVLLAVADGHQILLFHIKVKFHQPGGGSPIKVIAKPHTRIQVKSDIRLDPLSKGTWPASRLILFQFDPTRNDILYTLLALGTPGSYRVERNRLIPRKATPPAQQDNSIVTWTQDQKTDVILDSGVTATSMIVTADNQFLLLGDSSGHISAFSLDTLKLWTPPSSPAPPAQTGVAPPPPGEEAAAQSSSPSAALLLFTVEGSVVDMASSPTGNACLVVEGSGRAKVIELAHPWALCPTAKPQTIAGHIVHQLELCIAKQSDPWDVFLALGGILQAHPQAKVVFETTLKLLRNNRKEMSDQHKRFYRHVFETTCVRLYSMSSDHFQNAVTSSESRLLLFYLLDCFRFALPVMPRESASQAARRVPTFTTAAGSKLKASLNEMMFTMGESIVGLSVWCLRHATNIVKNDKEAGPAGGGNRNLGFSKNFLLDPEALTFTYDLLNYYLKRVQENAPKPTIMPPTTQSSMTPTAASNAPAAAAGSTATAAASSTSSAPAGPMTVPSGPGEKEEAVVVAPPPIQEFPIAPPPIVDDEMQDEFEVAPPREAHVEHDLPEEAQIKELRPKMADIEQLVEICEAVIAAHKGPQQAGAEGQTIADHQRIFKEMLSKKQVDPEVGLPGRLEASFGGDKFGQRSLEAYLALGMNEHGFLERALGFRGMKLSDEVSGASPQAMPHKALKRKRSFAEYAAEEVEASSKEGAPNKRRFDVLTRKWIKGDAMRECCTCARVTATDDPMYKRWAHACPMTGGKWRAPLNWKWGNLNGDGDDEGKESAKDGK